MFVEEEKETYYLIESFVCLNDCNEQEKKKKMLFFYTHHHYQHTIDSNI
jgi:hypothetical protein